MMLSARKQLSRVRFIPKGFKPQFLISKSSKLVVGADLGNTKLLVFVLKLI